MSSRWLAVRYGAGLACAHVLAVPGALAVAIPLSGRSYGATQASVTEKYLVTALAVVAMGAVAVAVAGVAMLTPTLRWFAAGNEPDRDQRRSAMRLLGRQSALMAATWLLSGMTFVLLNLDSGVAVAVLTMLGALFGGAAATGTALVLTQRTLRPILVAAALKSEGSVTAPGVLPRLVILWLVCSFLPCGTIFSLVVLRSRGWIIPSEASLEIPVVVVTVVAILLGLPLMILTSRSIADPIHEVVDAMTKVERGELGTYVGVFERSEIGQLQSGFNRMMGGLAERDRLHDLFGRHVGGDVARRALEEGASLSGEVREAGMLFIDLIGSTRIAASHPPEEVAELLNDFFRLVVHSVDEHHGFVNKFEGDAALAVFGVPLAADDAASDALATARELGARLRELPRLDFGIGVSAGPVFAGNVGAENRYEYTVIGDAVNEAARLADLAKTAQRRILCSGAALDRASTDERRHWASHDRVVLRGRSEATDISGPVDISA